MKTVHPVIFFPTYYKMWWIRTCKKNFTHLWNRCCMNTTRTSANQVEPINQWLLLQQYNRILRQVRSLNRTCSDTWYRPLVDSGHMQEWQSCTHASSQMGTVLIHYGTCSHDNRQLFLFRISLEHAEKLVPLTMRVPRWRNPDGCSLQELDVPFTKWSVAWGWCATVKAEQADAALARPK